MLIASAHSQCTNASFSDRPFIISCSQTSLETLFRSFRANSSKDIAIAHRFIMVIGDSIEDKRIRLGDERCNELLKFYIKNSVIISRLHALHE